MRARPCRKFGLLDAMILVAAAAVGALSLRLFRLYGSEELAVYRSAASGSPTSAYLGVAVKLAGAWLAALTPALVLIRLRGGRPPFVRTLRQPGATASLAASAALAAAAALAAIDMAILGVPPGDDFYFTFLPLITQGAGAAVGGVWFVQALGRRWRPERDWIDRSGRLLGACWILVLLLGLGDTFRSASLEIRGRTPGLSPDQIADDEQRRLRMTEEFNTLIDSAVKDAAKLNQDLREQKRRRDAKPAD